MSVRDDERLVREAYDRVPYPSASNHHAHPDRLATLALLHGLDAPPVSRCKVLELGCADGGNLIPMAFESPESHYTGIDLSPVQIETGRAQVTALGLTNVDLRAMSILDVDASLGTFDYIVCHGVFSWVTPEVQEKILAICRDHLSPNGVAYVSYNTYPGWHLRRIVRDMVRYHTRADDEPETRIGRALDLVQFLASTAGTNQDAFGVFLRDVQQQFDDYRERPSYVVHEYLEETNAPLYFHEFAARASAHGLQYLGDSEAELMELDNLPDEVAAKVRTFAHDRIETEQYLDFLLNRTFRRTLLCHQHVALEASAANVSRMFAATSAKAESAEAFKTERGRSLVTTHPLAQRVLHTLGALWPRAASFDELVANDDRGAVADLLHALFWNGVLDLHVAPPDCTNVVSARPRASLLARKQAAVGLLVTNQRRRVLKLDDPIARFLLQQLDGTRDHHELVRLLDTEVSAGRLDVSVDGSIPDAQRIPAVLQAVVQHHLRKMAELALLIG